MIKSKKKKNTARYITYIALMSASLTAFKFALGFIPNVEVVTLLIICYASTFGKKYTIPAVMIFCTIEMLIYGFGSWVLLYFIYWNMLALISSLLLKKPNVIIATLIGIVLTTLFGVLDTYIYVMFAGIYGIPASDLGRLFSIYYLRGGYFYLAHIVSNALVVPALYTVITKLLLKINKGEILKNKDVKETAKEELDEKQKTPLKNQDTPLTNRINIISNQNNTLTSQDILLKNNNIKEDFKNQPNEKVNEN